MTKKKVVDIFAQRADFAEKVREYLERQGVQEFMYDDRGRIAAVFHGGCFYFGVCDEAYTACYGKFSDDADEEAALKLFQEWDGRWDTYTFKEKLVDLGYYVMPGGSHIPWGFELDDKRPQETHPNLSPWINKLQLITEMRIPFDEDPHKMATNALASTKRDLLALIQEMEKEV